MEYERWTFRDHGRATQYREDRHLQTTSRTRVFYDRTDGNAIMDMATHEPIDNRAVILNGHVYGESTIRKAAKHGYRVDFYDRSKPVDFDAIVRDLDANCESSSDDYVDRSDDDDAFEGEAAIQRVGPARGRLNAIDEAGLAGDNNNNNTYIDEDGLEWVGITLGEDDVESDEGEDEIGDSHNPLESARNAVLRAQNDVSRARDVDATERTQDELSNISDAHIASMRDPGARALLAHDVQQFRDATERSRDDSSGLGDHIASMRDPGFRDRMVDGARRFRDPPLRTDSRSNYRNLGQI